MARERLNDPDLWWHLKLGQTIWNTHSVPRADLLSFTAYGHPWIPHEWLSQVFIYNAYKFAGYSGLMLWLCVCGSLISLAAYALCSFYAGNARVGFLGALTTWLFSTVGFSIRPQMIGYLLLILEMLILHLGHRRHPRWFLVLPPLFALWVNCHGSFPLGFLVLGIFLVCSQLDLRIGNVVSQRWRPTESKTLGVAFMLSAVALFANPTGLKQVLYPLNVMLSQPLNLSAISEWQMPQLHDPRTFALFGVIALILGRVLAGRSELFLQELILLGIGFVFAVQHLRMLFVFGVVAAPVLCRCFANVWGRYVPQRDDRLIPNAIVMFCSLVIVVLSFPTARNLQSQVEMANPTRAVQFINRAGLSGRILNEYNYGGYLLWASAQKVFIDGRCDIFEWTGVLGDYEKWISIQSDPRLLLDKYKIDFCLLSRDAAMSKVIPLLANWKEIYSDKQAIIFARSGLDVRRK